MADEPTQVNFCLTHQDQFPCDLTAFNAAFIGAIASLAGGIMVVCLSMRVRGEEVIAVLAADVGLWLTLASHCCCCLSHLSYISCH